MTDGIPRLDDSGNTTRHEEWLMDEAIRGSSLASDPFVGFGTDTQFLAWRRVRGIGRRLTTERGG